MLASLFQFLQASRDIITNSLFQKFPCMNISKDKVSPRPLPTMCSQNNFCNKTAVFAVWAMAPFWWNQQHFSFVPTEKWNEEKDSGTVNCLSKHSRTSQSIVTSRCIVVLFGLPCEYMHCKMFHEDRKRERTHVLLANKPCLHLHNFLATGVSNALVTSNHGQSLERSVIRG